MFAPRSGSAQPMFAPRSGGDPMESVMEGLGVGPLGLAADGGRGALVARAGGEAPAFEQPANAEQDRADER